MHTISIILPYSKRLGWGTYPVPLGVKFNFPTFFSIVCRPSGHMDSLQSAYPVPLRPDGIFIPSVTFISGRADASFIFQATFQTFGTGYIPRPARVALAHPLPFRQPVKPLGRGAYPVPLGCIPRPARNSVRNVYLGLRWRILLLSGNLSNLWNGVHTPSRSESRTGYLSRP